MKKVSRLEIRIPTFLKERLAQEAATCEESMNTYILMIIGHRKRVRVNVPSSEGHYLGYK